VRLDGPGVGPRAAIEVAERGRGVGAPRVLSALGWVGAAGLAVACLASLVPPYLSHSYVERAQDTWRTDPAAAFRDLDRGARANPWSVQPHVTAGTMAMALGQERASRRAFNRALRVERTWYPYLQLGLLDAQERKFRRAERRLERASRLNREDDVVEEALELVEERERVNAMAFTRMMLRTSLDNAARVG
jgi:Tfp pilus assembly protein PilF